LAFRRANVFQSIPLLLLPHQEKKKKSNDIKLDKQQKLVASHTFLASAASV